MRDVAAQRCGYATYAVGNAAASFDQMTRYENQRGKQATDSAGDRGGANEEILARNGVDGCADERRTDCRHARQGTDVRTRSGRGWTGVYLGIQGGAVRRDAQAELGSFGFKLDGSKTGGTAGAVLGYNWQQGRFVYGIEGDRSWMAPEPVILATWQPFRLRLMSIGFPRFVDVRGSHSTRPCST